MKPPYISFGIGQPNTELTVSTMAGHRAERNQALEHPFSTLESLNERGLEATATIVGKYVLMMLNQWHPDVLKKYPNLVITIPPGVTPPRLPIPPIPDDEPDGQM